MMKHILSLLILQTVNKNNKRKVFIVLDLISFGAEELLKCLGVLSPPLPYSRVVCVQNKLVVPYGNAILEDMCNGGFCDKTFTPWQTTYSVSSYGLESLGKFYNCEFVLDGDIGK